MHAIPVVYYHSIGNHPKSRPWCFLTVPIDVFVSQIEWLKRKGFFFATLSDVYDHMAGTRVLPRRSIVLTFDDGFLDNYTTVWAMAQKYDFRFTIYVNPEFMEDRPYPRPTLQNVWDGELSSDELEWWGYLSWEEMRLMEKSGLVDIQSHCMTHTWYPISGKVVDFHYPEDKYFWLWWNNSPTRKPYWLKEYKPELVPFGTPVFEHAKSLVARKCRIQGQHTEVIVKFVADNGGPDFFQDKDWRETLLHRWEKIPGTLEVVTETEEEHRKRLCDELVGSKQIIEERLGKRVEFLAWPGGGDSPTLQQLAHEAGYKATTKGTKANLPGADPSAVQRGSACFVPLMKPMWSKWFLCFQIQRLSKPSSLCARCFEWMKHLYKARRP